MCVLLMQEEQARNKKIMEALKAEKNALADEQAKLSTMLSQTKVKCLCCFPQAISLPQGRLVHT